MGNQHRPWREADDDELRQYQAEGLDYPEIGRRTGRSAVAVKTRARRLGVLSVRARRPWTSAEQARLVRLRREGASIADVATALGRSEFAVKQKVTETGASFERTDWTSGEVAELVRLRREGLNRSELAAKLGRTASSVHHKLTEIRVTFVCRLCRIELPAEEFPWKVERLPPCRDCLRATGWRPRDEVPRVIGVRDLMRSPSWQSQARMVSLLEAGEGEPMPDVRTWQGEVVSGHDHVLVRDGKVMRARCSCGVWTQPTTLAEIVVQARRHLTDVVANPSHQAKVARLCVEFHEGRYVVPDPQDWLERFTQRPEVVGEILHDIATRHIASEETTKRIGRRPTTLDRRLAWEAMPASVRRALENDGVLVGR